MANIVEFDAPQGRTPQPTDRAEQTAVHAAIHLDRFAREGGLALGHAVSEVGGQIGQRIDDHIAGQMIGHGSVVSSALTANLTKQITDTMTKADLNDISVGQGLRENVDKSIENFQSNFDDAPEKVRNWALATASHMRAQFGNSITAHEMTRAGAAVQKNMRDTVLNNMNTVDLDPSQLALTVAKQVNDFNAYVSTHGNIGTEKMVELRTELDKANGALAYTAAQSIGKKNPDALFKVLADGDYDKWLDPVQKERLEKFARSEKSYQHEQSEWAYKEQTRVAHETATTAKNEYVTDALNGKPVGDYKNDPRLARFPEEKEKLRTLQHTLVMQARDRSESTPHAQQWRDLITQLHDTAVNNPNNISDKPIYDLLRENKLNKNEFASALGIFHSIDNPIERQISTYVKRADSFTLQSTEGNLLKKFSPSDYADAVNRFELDGRAKIAAARQRGQDVTPLVDPNSKDFVFSQKKLQAMLPDQKEVVKKEADAVRESTGPSVAGLLGGPAVRSAPREFKNEAEVRAAGLPNGTVVVINGKRFVWNN